MIHQDYSGSAFCKDDSVEQSVTFSTLVAVGMFAGRWFPTHLK